MPNFFLCNVSVCLRHRWNRPSEILPLEAGFRWWLRVRSSILHHLKSVAQLQSQWLSSSDLWCVPDASYTTRTICSCGVISWLVTLIAFLFVFAIASCHWLVIASHISLSGKPARRKTQLYIVFHAQQDRAMHKLMTGITKKCNQVCKSI